MAAGNIDLWVSGGSLEAPYYRFYTNAAGTEELIDLSLDTTYTYTFRRLNNEVNHPFYVADPKSEHSDPLRIAITGEGNSTNGITGNQSFTLSFLNPREQESSLEYFCSSHKEMRSLISLNNGRESDQFKDGKVNVDIDNGKELSRSRWIFLEDKIILDMEIDFPLPSSPNRSKSLLRMIYSGSFTYEAKKLKQVTITDISQLTHESSYSPGENPLWTKSWGYSYKLKDPITKADPNLLNTLREPTLSEHQEINFEFSSEGTEIWSSDGKFDQHNATDDWSVVLDHDNSPYFKEDWHTDLFRYGYSNNFDYGNYLIEFKTENIPPTGAPTLNGDFKVGQTISIDASDIDDADNFEGWTPNYEYSWEVSGDNGATWTALNSSDATNGDDSYTLTSEEVGKQLRGVVRYLDGYESNEVVESNGSPIISATWFSNWQTPNALSDGIIDVSAGETLEFNFDVNDSSTHLSLSWGAFTADLPWQQSYDLGKIGSGTYNLDYVKAWINATEDSEFQQYFWSNNEEEHRDYLEGKKLSLEDFLKLSGINLEHLSQIQVANPDAKIPKFTSGSLSTELNDHILDIKSGESSDVGFVGSYTGDTTHDWLLSYSYLEQTPLPGKARRTINRVVDLTSNTKELLKIPLDFLPWVDGTWNLQKTTLWGLEKGLGIESFYTSFSPKNILSFTDPSALESMTGLKLPKSINVINIDENIDLKPPSVRFISATEELKPVNGVTIDSDNKKYTYILEVDDGSNGSGLGDLLLILEHFPWDSPISPWDKTQREFVGWFYSNYGYVDENLGKVGSSLDSTIKNPIPYWGTYNNSDLQFIPHIKFTDKAGNTTDEWSSQGLLPLEFRGEVDYIVNGTHPPESPIWVHALDITGESMPIKSLNLDVDGDGKVNLYTDGIMIIRRLIGLDTCTSGFADDYFKSNNRYTAERVDALLDQAYSAGTFDFDQNGKTNLYTDGILLIRHLISPSLIANSTDIISADSDFKSNPEGLNAVFEALKPE